MDDGKPTGSRARWWSRPATDRPEPVQEAPPSDTTPDDAPRYATPWAAPDPAGPPPHPAPTMPPYGPHPAYVPAPPVIHPGFGPWGRYDPWNAAPPSKIPDPDRTPGSHGGKRGLAVTAAVALVAALIGGAIGAYLEHDGGGFSDVSLPQERANAGGRAPDSVAGIASSALPGVVTLHVTGADEAGTGTGFVLDRQGHILTNNHVVAAAGRGGEISVTFSGGRTADAKLVGKDSGYDLAVVQVSGIHDLTPLPLGNSDNVRVGDPVVAIGAPFDLSNTVTSGIISAKDRPITAGGEGAGGAGDVSFVDALQTDAPINPGNSGGPLVDAHARVIGINSAIRAADDTAKDGTGQSGSIGLGFAIPINQGKRVAEELINTGHAVHPVIGVTLDMNYGGDGAKVGVKAADGGPAVSVGGPGDSAGVRSGDVITAIDGERVHNGEELIVRIRAHRPGDRLKLVVRRDDTTRTISLRLGSAEGR